MKNARTYIRALGVLFLGLGLSLGYHFWVPGAIDLNPAVWLDSSYYGQFLPFAVCVMLILSGLFLALDHGAANFNLAVFGHTASEEALFHWLGFTRSVMPTWALWSFFVLSAITLWIAYSNVLQKKRLSLGEALFGVLFGAAVVLLPRIS